jgi:hypothetical protein
VQILRVQDPRDSLDKARRTELIAFARQHKIGEIVPGMPATLMRRILRSKGLTQISVQERMLGMRQKPTPKITTEKPSRRTPDAEAEIVTVDADDDLLRQWQSQQSRHVAEESVVVVRHKPYRDPARPTMAEVKKEAKRLGLKPPRTMKMPELIELVERTSNGKDAA